MSDNLPAFEGHDVHKAKLRITGAGDGLSEALALAPKAYHAGETMCLVLRARVSQINHVAEKDTDALVRVHTAVVDSITEVEDGAIRKYLDSATENIRLARDKAKGQEQLPIGESNGKPGKDLQAMRGRRGVAGLGPEGEFDPAALPEKAPA